MHLPKLKFPIGIHYQPYLNDTNYSEVCPCAHNVVIQLYMHLSNVIPPQHLGLPQVMIIGGDCHTALAALDVKESSNQTARYSCRRQNN